MAEERDFGQFGSFSGAVNKNSIIAQTSTAITKISSAVKELRDMLKEAVEYSKQLRSNADAWSKAMGRSRGVSGAMGGGSSIMPNYGASLEGPGKAVQVWEPNWRFSERPRGLDVWHQNLPQITAGMFSTVVSQDLAPRTTTPRSIMPAYGRSNQLAVASSAGSAGSGIAVPPSQIHVASIMPRYGSYEITTVPPSPPSPPSGAQPPSGGGFGWRTAAAAGIGLAATADRDYYDRDIIANRLAIAAGMNPTYANKNLLRNQVTNIVGRAGATPLDAQQAALTAVSYGAVPGTASYRNVLSTSSMLRQMDPSLSVNMAAQAQGQFFSNVPMMNQLQARGVISSSARRNQDFNSIANEILNEITRNDGKPLTTADVQALFGPGGWVGVLAQYYGWTPDQVQILKDMAFARVRTGRPTSTAQNAQGVNITAQQSGMRQNIASADDRRNAARSNLLNTTANGRVQGYMSGQEALAVAADEANRLARAFPALTAAVGEATGAFQSLSSSFAGNFLSTLLGAGIGSALSGAIGSGLGKAAKPVAKVASPIVGAIGRTGFGRTAGKTAGVVGRSLRRAAPKAGAAGAVALGADILNQTVFEADEPEQQSGWQKAGSIAAQTATWAGMGATIGSLFPGPGTLIGGIVGGVAGLGAGLVGTLGGGASDAGGGGGSPAAKSNTIPANALIQTAISQIGIPYSWGGGNRSGPTKGIEHGRNTVGFDCSGLMVYIFGKYGVNLPRTAREQAKVGRTIPRGQERPGDMLFFSYHSTFDHVALYIGNNQMVEAPRTGLDVRIARVPWSKVVLIKRVLNTAGNGPDTTSTSSPSEESSIGSVNLLDLGSKIGTAGSPEIFIKQFTSSVAGDTAPEGDPGSKPSKGTGNIPKGPMSIKQVADVLRSAGFTGNDLVEAVAIASKESGFNPMAHNPNASTGDNSYGLFQINMLGGMGPERRKRYGLESNADLFDPYVNAKVAYSMSKGGQDWGPWTTNDILNDQNYLNKIRKQIGGSYAQGAWKVSKDQIASIHEGEMIVPAGVAETLRTAIREGFIGAKGGNGQTIVEINVNLANADTASAVKLANTVKSLLSQNELTSTVRSR